MSACAYLSVNFHEDIFDYQQCFRYLIRQKGKTSAKKIYHCKEMWLYRFKEHEEMLARWIEKLGQFHFEIHHQATIKKHHVYSECQRLRIHLTLKKIFKYLYKIIVRPLYRYANAAWANVTKTGLNKTQQEQNKAIKREYNLPMRTSINELHQIGNLETVNKTIYKLILE